MTGNGANRILGADYDVTCNKIFKNYKTYPLTSHKVTSVLSQDPPSKERPWTNTPSFGAVLTLSGPSAAVTSTTSSTSSTQSNKDKIMIRMYHKYSCILT